MSADIGYALSELADKRLKRITAFKGHRCHLSAETNILWIRSLAAP